MNILFLANHLNIGGITSYILSLARGLKKRGHSIFVASSGGRLLSNFTAAGTIHIPIPIKTKNEFSPKVLISTFKLLNRLKEFDIEIIHSNTRTTQVLGCLLSKKSGIIQISTCHGFFKKRFSRKIFPCWGDKIIAISESVKEHLMKDFGVNEKNIRVIHNGVDVERFKNQKLETRDQIKKDLGLADGPVIGIVARLSEEKGHIYLIEAMKEVLKRIPEAQLLIIGEGKKKEGLVRCVKDLGITKEVFFLPSVEDTSKILLVMDIFVLPSLKEGLGLSLMEAQAAGLAVVATDVGGLRSLIQHDKNGLLVKPACSEDITEAILELLQNPQKRASLAKQAQISINENFSLYKMALETERLYLECLNERY